MSIDESFVGLSRDQQRLLESGACIFATADSASRLLGIARDFNLSKTVLVIHNGDRLPSVEVMEALSDIHSKVFSVNWLRGGPITAIPIGLENRRLLMHGDVSAFTIPPHDMQRKVKVLLSFLDGTNSESRTAARRALRGIPGALERAFLTQSAYVKALHASFFVVSPPGNGPDCHRTWEAIYAGAVPIVHRDAWPREWLHLPVMHVADWDEAAVRLQGDFEREYVEARSRPSDMAYFPYWDDRMTAALATPHPHSDM